jgi:ribose/xylose/arabinose/galactoside ABC-type transport system permease subunit
MPWWKRLFMAQEAGLVLVIALIMAMLTIFGGSISRPEILRADTGTTVSQTDSTYTITVDGRPRTLPMKVADAPSGSAGADGYELRNTPSGSMLMRSQSINKFLNLENLVQLLVNASFIAIMAVAITAVIAMGGIDLSIGSIYALAALMVALVLRYAWPEGVSGLAPKVFGSTAVWFGALAIGAIALIVAIVTGTRKPGPKAAGTEASKAMAKALAAAAIGVLIVAGWAIVREMRDNWRGDQLADLKLWATLPLALIVALIVGGLCGLLNGTMIVGLRVHPFIITLGTMAAYRGLCTLPTKSQSVANMSPSFQDFLTFDVNGVTPVPVGIMLIIALIGFVVLGYTVLGRQVYAIGGNEVAAKYAGIPVGKVKIIVYTIMGMMAGLAGFLYVGYYGAAEPAAGTGYELSVIAAAVIGGASLSGGRGSPTGAVLGAILVQLIDNSLVILDIDQSYKQIVIGGAIVGAVVLDQLKSRLMPMGR